MKKIFSLIVLLLTIPILLANTVPEESSLKRFTYDETSQAWEKIDHYYYLQGNILIEGNWFYLIDIDLPKTAVIEIKSSSPTSSHGTGNEWIKIDKYDPSKLEFNRLVLAITYNDEWGGYFEVVETNVNSLNYNGKFRGTYIVNENPSFEIRYFMPEVTNPSEFHTLEDLPTTEERVLANVYFTVNLYEVIITIWYQGTPYSLQYNFNPQTDMTMFNTAEAYFIKRNNKPQIYINLSTDRLYLRDILSSETDAKPAFVPHVIWDLNSNTLTRVEKYNAYAYVKQNNEGVLIAYYYVDEFIMDNILSTSLTYTSREHRKNVFGLINEYTPWETKQWSHTSTSEINYRNLTANWQLFIPFYNIIFANIRTNTYYQMPAIQALDFNNLSSSYNVSKAEIELEYSKVNQSFSTLKNNPRYKVWAFALEEGKNANAGFVGKVQTEFYHNPDNQNDPRNLKVIEIVYMTDEKIYTTVGQDMNLLISIDDSIDGIANEETGISPVLIALISGIVIIAFGLIQGKLFTKKGLNISYIFGAALMAVIVYLILVNWEFISTLMVYNPWNR